jgi:phospholipid/cholesterol/gamma-HCH transport system substrate-binding protein
MNIFGVKYPLVNNQTKVGLFALITVIIFILGFYFLKGINLFTPRNRYYAVFDNIDGIYKSNPVVVNGHRIGAVNAEYFDINTGRVVIEMVIDNNFTLYDSCLASIASTDLVGSKEISIRYKISGRTMKSGDTLCTSTQPGILEKLTAAIDPLQRNISHTLKNLDSVLNSISGAIGKEDPTSTIHKLNAALDNIHNITASLETTLQKGKLDSTLSNMASITGNLEKNNDGIKRIIHNVADLTDTLKAADLATTIGRARMALSSIDTLLYNINNGDGTVSHLIKDKRVYNDLDSAILSLNTLLADVKSHPFRYVNVSVFGGQKRDDKYKAKQLKDAGTKK